MEDLAAQLATETHNRLHWQGEAERLNRQVHVLRRELQELRVAGPWPQLRALHTAASQALPMVRFADLRWDPGRRSGAVAGLEAALTAAGQALADGQRTVANAG